MERQMTQHWEDFKRDLARLIAIESIAEPGCPEPMKPYGESCAQALAWMLERAAAMGLRTGNIDGYAGYAEWGEGEIYCAVLAHVDVVPAGYGWTDPPFALSEREGRLYGRGVADDKGAALAALYCLKQLKDSGTPCKRRVRVIFGCGEECGMADMEHYFAREPLPDMAFTPDSDYGVCNREKGILQIKCSVKPEPCGRIRALSAGAAVNAVPDFAQVTLSLTDEQEEKLSEWVEGKKHEARFKREKVDGELTVTAFGRGSHAMCPGEGVNAAAHLIALLNTVFGGEIGNLLDFLRRYVGLETDGRSLGIACEDEPSGALTCNFSTVTRNERCGVFSMDIRYPVTADGGKILERLRDLTAQYGMEISVIHHLPPVYLPPDHPLIALLTETYESVTGEQAALYATGGGTYARTLRGRGVAFGPVFPGQGDPAMHKPDENMEIGYFQTHMEICYRAMERMAGMEV